MTYCSGCGAKVPDGARFCPKCGHTVALFESNEKENEKTAVATNSGAPNERNDTQSPEKQKKRISKPTIVIGVMLLGVLIGVISFLSWNHLDGPIQKNKAFDMAISIVRLEKNDYSLQFCKYTEAHYKVDENGYYTVTGWAYEKGTDPVNNSFAWATSFIPISEYEKRVARLSELSAKEEMNHDEEVEYEILTSLVRNMEMKKEKGDWVYSDAHCIFDLEQHQTN